MSVFLCLCLVSVFLLATELSVFCLCFCVGLRAKTYARIYHSAITDFYVDFLYSIRESDPVAPFHFFCCRLHVYFLNRDLMVAILLFFLLFLKCCNFSISKMIKLLDALLIKLLDALLIKLLDALSLP